MNHSLFIASMQKYENSKNALQITLMFIITKLILIVAIFWY